MNPFLTLTDNELQDLRIANNAEVVKMITSTQPEKLAYMLRLVARANSVAELLNDLAATIDAKQFVNLYLMGASDALSDAIGAFSELPYGKFLHDASENIEDFDAAARADFAGHCANFTRNIMNQIENQLTAA